MGAASNDAVLATEACKTIQCKTKPTNSFPVGLKLAARIPADTAIVLCKCPSLAGATAELLLVSILGGSAGAQPASLQSELALGNIKLMLAHAIMLGMQYELSSLKGQLAIEQSENQLLRVDLERANTLTREYEGLRAKQTLSDGLHQKSQATSHLEVALGSPQPSIPAHWDTGHASGDKDMCPAAAQEQDSPVSSGMTPAGAVVHAGMITLPRGQRTAASRDHQTVCRAAQKVCSARGLQLTLGSTAWARHSTEAEAVAASPRGSRIPKAPASPRTAATTTSKASRQMAGSCSLSTEPSKVASRAPAAVPQAFKTAHTMASSSAARSKGALTAPASPGKTANSSRTNAGRQTDARSTPASVCALAPLVGVGMQPKEVPSTAMKQVQQQEQVPHRVASSDVDLVGPMAGLSDESTSWLLVGDSLGAWQRTPSLVLR